MHIIDEPLLIRALIANDSRGESDNLITKTYISLIVCQKAIVQLLSMWFVSPPVTPPPPPCLVPWYDVIISFPLALDSYLLVGLLLEFYILATSKVISG